jgi:hypothetical protein
MRLRLALGVSALVSCASLGTYDGPTSTCLRLQAPQDIACDGPPRALRTGEICAEGWERVVLENCRRGGQRPAEVTMPASRMDCRVREEPPGACYRR